MRLASALKTASIVGLGCLVACASGRDSDQGKPAGYEAAARASRRNTQTMQGKRYVQAVTKALKPVFEDARKACLSGVPDHRGFRLLYRIDAEGNPVEALLHPVSESSECFLETVRNAKLPIPPKPDYWITILHPRIQTWGMRP